MAQTQQNDGFQSRLTRRVWKLFYWTFAWVLSTALLALGPKYFWNRGKALTLVAFGIDLAVGVGMILANKSFLQDQDELQRKIHLEAMGITLGVVFIAISAYPLARAYEAVPFDAGVAHLAVLMSVTYLTSLLMGHRRYR